MNKGLIEFYRSNGWMPDWIYNQVNGKSAQENYIEQHDKITKRVRESQEVDEIPELHITSEVKVKR